MVVVFKGEGEAWEQEGGDKVKAVDAWESDTGARDWWMAGEIMGTDTEWDLKDTE